MVAAMVREIAEIGQCGVAGVEQPQLHVFERGHVGDELHTGGSKIRAPRGKAIFDDPLRERLGDDRPCVGHAERGCNGRTIGVGGFGNDPVDHRRRKGDLVLDPVSEFARPQSGELRHNALHGMTVGGEVVAGENGEGRGPRIAPSRQCRHDEARG